MVKGGGVPPQSAIISVNGIAGDVQMMREQPGAQLLAPGALDVVWRVLSACGYVSLAKRILSTRRSVVASYWSASQVGEARMP